MPKERPLMVFFPLAFLLSWYPYIIGKTHFVKTSGGMNPLGVMVAAILAAAICYGGPGVKQLLGRYLRWRIRPTNYILALFLPAFLVSLAALLNLLLGAVRPTGAQLALWPEMLPRFIFIFLFIGLGEETGWRGFALPELQKRLSPLAAGIIVGMIWATWHIPLIGIEFRRSFPPSCSGSCQRLCSAHGCSIAPREVCCRWRCFMPPSTPRVQGTSSACLLAAISRACGGFSWFSGWRQRSYQCCSYLK